MIDSRGKLVSDLQVTAVGEKGRRTAKVSQGGSFEFEALASGDYQLIAESTSRRNKIVCEETSVSVERNALNEAVVKCEVKETTELEVGAGGSFLLLAVVVVAAFVYFEREQIRLAF